MRNISDSLKKEGLFFIEARSTKDELYGKGKKVAKNAFIYNNHFRRFIDKQEFERKLEELGFKIIFIEEKKGFSQTKESNPTLIRLIVKKT